MDAYLGELAALGTALCWCFTSIFFTMSGRLVGSPIVNRTRLLFAVIAVSLLNWITQGELLPIHAELERWGWLGLSGLIGFVIGDALLFQAFVMIGARLSMLIMVLAPVFSVALGWGLLGEKLSAQELIGIALACGGVAWVVTDRVKGESPAANTQGVTIAFQHHSTRHYVVGVLCGVGGALGQAGGLICSKQGLEGDFPALSGNLIRLTISTLIIWGMATLSGSAAGTFGKLREKPQALKSIIIGAILGPFIGVTLSLYAVQHAAVGIASTLMGLTPVFLIPIAYVAFHEKVGLRAIFGTLLAVGGTAVIFLA